MMSQRFKIANWTDASGEARGPGFEAVFAIAG